PDTSSVDFGQADGHPGPTAPSQAPSPASDAASLSEAESEVADTQSQVVLNEDSFDTLVGCRPVSELFPGTLQLFIDVGTDGQVRAGDKVFFLGDLDEARERLPEICTERRTEWSQLYLRIRKPTYKGQDSMVRVMLCLRPYLCYFTGVHLVMNAEFNVNGLGPNAFYFDFPRLLFLCVEGEVDYDRTLLFPLHNLLHLNLKTKMHARNILNVLCWTKKLETLHVDYQDIHDTVIETGVAEVPPNANLPPIMYIRTSDPTAILPLLQGAEGTTRDLRLTVKTGSQIPSVVRELFTLH
ncbi:hypothetical protein EV715DRAFT_265479, partial [Schizophyllum commune]